MELKLYALANGYYFEYFIVTVILTAYDASGRDTEGRMFWFLLINSML